MRYSVKGLLNATKNFTILDFAFFKISLLSAGILLGAYFASFFMGYVLLLKIVFILSTIWVVYRTFFTHMR